MSDLSELFSGPFARFAEALLLDDGGRESVEAAALLDSSTLRQLLARSRPRFAEEDLRGVATLWSKHYFARLLAPVLYAILVRGRRLPLSLEQLRIVIDEQGRAQAFVLAHAGEPFADQPSIGRLLPLLKTNLEPFVQTLSQCSGLAPRVLWSNAGNYFEAALRQLAGLAGPSVALAEGDALLQTRLLPDGQRNPLFEPVRYPLVEHTDGLVRPWRRRRLCCIRDLLPDLGLCPNCPRLKVPAAPQ